MSEEGKKVVSRKGFWLNNEDGSVSVAELSNGKVGIAFSRPVNETDLVDGKVVPPPGRTVEDNGPDGGVQVPCVFTRVSICREKAYALLDLLEELFPEGEPFKKT